MGGRGLAPLTVMAREAWEARQKKAGGATAATVPAKQLRRVLGGPVPLTAFGF